MIFLGIDLHSNNFTCCFIHEDGAKEKMTFAITPDSLNEFYRYLDKNTAVIIEASTNTFKFAERIIDKVYSVHVANTHKLKLISMVKKKTDKVDSEKLAVYLKMQMTSHEELMEPVYIPDQTIQDLRSLFTSYRLIRKQIGAHKNRIHALLKQHLLPFTKEYIFGKKNRDIIKNLEIEGIAKFQLLFFFEVLEHLEASITQLEGEIYLIGSKYIKEIDILTSMKGISVITAIAIIADIATVDRFPDSKHFSSYLRSAPGVDSSNETTFIKKTNKYGRKHSITLLSQSLNHFRDSNPKLRSWYEKKELTHKKGKLRMALCRKVFVEIYHMLKKNEYHYYRNKQLHLKKMDNYYKFLDTQGAVFQKIA
jgi:transposase